jgi:hypothetical protein
MIHDVATWLAFCQDWAGRVGLRIRPLICGFMVVSTGDLVLVDESAKDRCAMDAVLGEVDGARRSGLCVRRTELAQGAVRPVSVVVPQVRTVPAKSLMLVKRGFPVI